MASDEHFLVTGAFGCIGAWTVASLVRDSTRVTTFDLGNDPYRLRYLMTDEELKRARFVKGDVTDLSALEELVANEGITHIIHLAALQVPFCRADPPLGAQVNVTGTVNIFEVAKRHRDQVQHVVYASSAAVYGPQSAYEVSPVPVHGPLQPGTHYGVYKQANEGTAHIYWQNDGISSIGLRPYIVYGVGRDQGLTSGPSKAMLAAAVGREYHIGHGGRADYQWAGDVAQTFIACARARPKGASVHNLTRNGANVSEIVAAIEAAVPSVAGKITYDADTLLPFPDTVDDSSLSQVLDQIPATPLEAGVRSTIELFAELARVGKINLERTLNG
jgi:nucleoside-diphosphate-sugar epimerase